MPKAIKKNRKVPAIAQLKIHQKSASPSHPDWLLFSLITSLIIFGLISSFLVSFPISLQLTGSPWHFVFKQIVAFFIGLILALIFYKISLKKLEKSAFWFFIVSFILLLLVFLPVIGKSSGGAQRWLNLGAFSLQPSELVKLGLIIYLAAWLAKNSSKKYLSKTSSLRMLAPFAVTLTILLAILLFQRDMSTLIIIGLTSLAMYFIAKTPFWHSILLWAGSVATLAVFIKTAPYRLQRLMTFLHPGNDPLNSGYHINQSLIAIGSGKLWGLGFGLSKQKFGFVPQPFNDSIFSILGEELGFIGSLFLLFAFLLLFFLVVKIIKIKENPFERLLIFGIAFWIVFQSFFNIAGNLGLVPLAGVPLPFFSAGGSHLIAEITAMGLLLNISKRSESPDRGKAPIGIRTSKTRGFKAKPLI